MTTPATSRGIQVAGYSRLYVAFPTATEAGYGITSFGYAVPYEIGEQMDETTLTVTPVYHDVPGDSNGGPQGQPIEVQDLGFTVSGSLALSAFDPRIVSLIEKSFRATEGAIAASEVGELVLKNHAVRMIVRPSRITKLSSGTSDPTGVGDDHFFYNFPCVLFRSPRRTGQGTKFSKFVTDFVAYKAPVGHAKAGIVYDRDGEVFDA